MFDLLEDARMIAYISLSKAKASVCCNQKPCVRARRACVCQLSQRNPLVLGNHHHNHQNNDNLSRNAELDVRKGGLYAYSIALLLTVRVVYSLVRVFCRAMCLWYRSVFILMTVFPGNN